jgi:hypothetical protein
VLKSTLCARSLANVGPNLKISFSTQHGGSEKREKQHCGDDVYNMVKIYGFLCFVRSSNDFKFAVSRIISMSSL